MDSASFITAAQPELLLDRAGITGKAEEFESISEDEVILLTYQRTG